MPLVALKAAFSALATADLRGATGPVPATSLQGMLNLAAEFEKFRKSNNRMLVRLIVDGDGVGVGVTNADIDLGDLNAFELEIKPEFVSTNFGKSLGRVKRDLELIIRKNNPVISTLLARLGIENGALAGNNRLVKQVQFIGDDMAVVVNWPDVYGFHKFAPGQDTEEENYAGCLISIDTSYVDFWRGVFLASEVGYAANFPAVSLTNA
ncbi:MAG: hypothetical protein SFU91_00675 [Chloroherpetonaceae bacterium]|nr:hypothetical protein [Chloroherpetonaceae bacterium]